MTPSLPDLSAIEMLLVEATSRASAAGQHCRANCLAGKQADRFVARVMQEFLRERSHFTLVCEEDACSHALLRRADHVFLIDPIDGTSGFDRGDPEFAHMGAFLSHGIPVAAAIACPGYGWLLSGNTQTGKVWSRDIDESGATVSVPWQPTLPDIAGLRAVISQSELTAPVLALLEKLGVESVMLSDSAVAFCHVLLGNADIFLRTLPNCEWDIAAGHALIRIQNGAMSDLQGGPILYGKPGLRNSGFIAYSVAAKPGGHDHER